MDGFILFNKGEYIMCETFLDEFKREMAPAEKLYTAEIRKFAEGYDFLGDSTILEEPDIDTQEYVYSFQKLNGTCEDVLDKALGEFYDHMIEFSKENGIYDFCINTVISFER